MRYFSHGRLRQQFRFLKQQFLQDEALPASNLLSEEFVAKALAENNVDWVDRLYTPVITLWLFIGQVLRADQSCRAGFYASLGRKPSQRTQRGDRVREAVAQVYAETDAIYGAAKIAAELKERNDLEPACRNTVAKAMKQLGIASKVRRRGYRPTTTKADPSKRPAANVLNREFAATGPDQKWVTDISVPQKRRERWEFGLPQSACRSRLQTTISGCV